MKQDIIMGIGTDVGPMDTRITRGDQNRSMIMHVLEPLLWPDDEGKQKGILSASWEPLLDPPGWRVKLPPGVKFSNGEPFDARSVKYTIESVIDPANKEWVNPVGRTQMEAVTEVKVENDLTAVILTKAFSRMVPYATTQNPMLPPGYGTQKGKEFGSSPIGTGHYKFVEYRAKGHLRLEVNPGYNGHWEGPAKNSSLTFRFLTENATRLAALEAGEVHLIDNVPPDAIERIKKNPNLDVMVSPTVRINGMFFHTARPPFDNLKARQAVAHAIDREALVKTIMGGMTEVAKSPFPPGNIAVVGETFPPLTYDPAKAKQYFAEAGLTKGTKVKLGGSVGRYINDKQVTTAVAGMLADVGFDPQLELLEWSAFWPKAGSQGYYDLFYLGWNNSGYDPEEFRSVYGSGAKEPGITLFATKNQRLVELFDLLGKASAQAEIDRHAKEMAHLLWDQVAAVYLFYEPNIAGVSKQLKGWKPRRDSQIFLWGANLG